MDPCGEVKVNNNADAEQLVPTPPASNTAMQMNPHLMGQVCPGLWVGELASITEIRKRPPPPLSDSNQSISTITVFPATSTTTKWTIISLLKSEKLKHFIHSTLDAIQKKEAAEAAQENDNEKKQQQQQFNQKNDFASIASTQHRIVIQRHVEWEIADKSESDLLSPRLEEILTIMEEALGGDNIDKNKEEASQESSTSSSSSSTSSSCCCLVHCALGISRSVALCAAYLLWKQQRLTLQAALTQIRNVRPQAAPNLGFIACLRALEQCHGNVALARKRMASKKK